jgi:hypothetical protein
LTRCLLDTMPLESIVSKLWSIGSELLQRYVWFGVVV